MYYIKLLLNLPLGWVPILCYLLSKERKKIDMDIDAFCKVIRGGRVPVNYAKTLYELFASKKEFRSVFYMRLGHISELLSIIWKPMPLLYFPIKSRNVGGGVFVQHGWATVVDAASVGENFWVNQNVAIGWRKNGHPTIGNNVRIGTGAVVLGDIVIGDNVNIGANAIVVEDVPSNCTICSPKAQIVKRMD